MSELKNKLSKILDHLNETEKDLHPLQVKILNNALNDIEGVLDHKDAIFSLTSNRFALWEHSVSSAKKEIFAIATNRGGKSGYGFSLNQKLLNKQREMIDKGVKIHRIFSIDEYDYKNFDFIELVRAQLKIGIDVWIARSNVTNYLYSIEEYEQENFVIIDDLLLYRSFVDENTVKNSITYEKNLIKKYLETFDNLKNHSHQFSLNDLPKDFKDI